MNANQLPAGSEREDVRFLGRLLGNVIRTQEGEAVFARIEGIRRSAVALYRGAGKFQEERLAELLRELSLVDTLRFARAFTCFSLLANLAEDRRRRRDVSERSIDGTGSGWRSKTLAAAVEVLNGLGTSRVCVARLLRTALIVPVLTAHPTEVRRKSIIDREIAISELMNILDHASDQGLRAEIESEIHRQIALLWQTRLLRAVRPLVADEIEKVLSYFRSTFFPVLPRLHATWEAVLGESLPSFVRLGSWIGGDRDGNPNVTAETLTFALSRQAGMAINYYLDELHALGAELSISSSLSPVSSALEKLANASSDLSPHRADEPYRRAITGIYARLAATHEHLANAPVTRKPTIAAPAYRDAGSFMEDLGVLSESLSENGGPLMVGGRLRRLKKAVEAFGFHMATLDVRQNADVHRRFVGELLRVAGVEDAYEALTPEERVKLLRRELAHPRLLRSPYHRYSDEAAREYSILEAIADAHARYGPSSITSYIVSKTSCVADLLEVLLLLKEVGLYRVNEPDRCAIAPVPLFETISDLRAAPEIMKDFFSIPDMVDLARSRGQQEVMIGYSDSNKDGGYLASIWCLHETSRAMLKTFEAYGVRMQLFHGRGGSVGRGGGSSFDGIRAQPARTVGGRIRITEQGEVVASKYGDPAVGAASLETITAATVLASLAPPDRAIPPQFYEAASTLSETALKEYRALVHGTPGFSAFFWAATPIREIAALNIGSRPASRTKSDAIGDLRAIPWVFSWAQTRVMLPGWYGLGSALATFSDRPLLRSIAQEWPFFMTALSNVEMVLAKADLRIAAAYADLVLDEDIRRRIFTAIKDECLRTRDQVLDVLGQTVLLESKPDLARSINLRLPYIEPLNYLQIELLRRHREGEADGTVREAIQLTINGIAAGLRNSG